MRRSDLSAFGRAAALVLGVLLLAGCTVSGSPAAQYPDPKSLDVGAFGFQPLDEPAGAEKYGHVVESARLAEVIVNPVEVDPALSEQLGPNGVHLLPTAAKATLLLAAPVRAVLEREGMLAGAAVGGTNATTTSRPAVGSARVLSLLIMRFPNVESAQRAARDIDVVDAAMSPDNLALAMPEYPAAHAHWRPTVPTAAATIADGSFVVSLYLGETVVDAKALTDLARKAFDAQLPRLRAFQVTPPEQLAALPLDREGMLRHIVPEAPRRWPYPIVVVNTPQRDASWDQVIRAEGVVYGPRGAQLWNGHTPTDGHIELMAVNGLTSLTRYSSATAARGAYNKSVRNYASDSEKREVPGPAGVPDIYCAEDTSSRMAALLRYGCRVLHERYQAMLVGPDLTDIRQRAAAQYGLLLSGG